LAGVTVLLVWAWSRGGSDADRLRAELEAQGECFTLEALGLEKGVPQDPDWAILKAMAPHFEAIDEAQVDPIKGWGHEQARASPPQVAWQQPFLYSRRRTILEWESAATIADRTRPELARLHDVLQSGVPEPGWDDLMTVPNYWPVRVAAQGLGDLVVVELHREETAQAYTNLLTLVRLCRGQHAPRTLVSHMIQVAVTGLAADTVWQALQAPGWTDDQLKTLQQELARVDLLGPLPRVLELERISQLQAHASYRAEGVDYMRETYKQFGVPAAKSGGWKMRLHHLHWRMARESDVELQTIQELQRLVEGARLVADGRPINALPSKPVGSARSPIAAWLDNWADPGGQVSVLNWFNEAPNFDRGLLAVARNEAMRRLAVTALGLERFRLNTGRLPETLEELVPDYLEAVPVDPFDGQSVRYEPEPGGKFALRFQTAEGDMRKLRDGGLPWPVAGPPLPPPRPVRSVLENLSDEVEELLVFDEVPLMEAIRELARKAKMNYILDVHVAEQDYPPVSIRLEHVTAGQAIEVLLHKNQLRVKKDPKVDIYLITR
jgi:hypothetical protein